MESTRAYGTLVCLRRGPVEERFDQVALGDDDPPLEADDARSAAVVRTLAGFRPDRVISSDLLRARETAERVAESCEAPLGVHRRLRPRHFGRWQGRAWSEIVAEETEASKAFLSDYARATPPEGESLATVRERIVADVLWELHRFKRKTVCWIGHADPIRCLIAEALDLELPAVQRLQLDEFGLTVLRFQGPGSSLTLLNHPADGTHPFSER